VKINQKNLIYNKLFLSGDKMVVKKIKEKLSQKSKKQLMLIALGFGIFVGIIFGYLGVVYLLSNAWDLPFISFAKPKYGIEMSTIDLNNKVKNYIDKNFLESYSANAEIINSTQLNGITIMQIAIMQNGAKVSDGEVYVTNDGELLIIGAVYNMSVNLQPQNLQQNQPAQTQIPKTDKPSVKLFVMSYCPYGQQAENAMWPVLDLLGDKINFELHFVIYPAQYYAGQEDKYCINKTYCSMHGVAELNENIRQRCIIEKYDYSVWKEYIKEVSTSCNYQNVDSCWEDIAKSKGIDTEAVKKCFDENALKYAEEEYKLNQQYGVQGSPALFINDVEYIGSRTPEAYKTTICNAFNQEPSSCSTQLSSSGGTVSGSCG